jgi:tetratricopeptide (TPR) repeat protein
MAKKRLLLALLAFVVVLSGCASTGGAGGASLDAAIEQSAAEIAGRLPAGTRVAVVAFDSPHGNLSFYIMDELAGALTGGSLEVADWNNLEYVYKELGFQYSGEVDDESAQAIGKFLAARYVIIGQLVDIGEGYRYRLNGINVETAIQESSTRMDVQNDRRFQQLYKALEKAAPVVRAASYGGASTPKTAGTFLDRGIGFAMRGEYEMAIADFTEALNLDPDMQAAWMLRGRALYASVSDVYAVDENFGGVGTITTFNDVVSDEKMAVYDRAIADFTQAIRLNPDYAKAYLERGNAYDGKGDYDRAIADYTQAIRLDPDDAEAYNDRGIAYRNKGDYDRAIADFTQAIRLDPDYALAYNNQGLAYYNKGDYDRAIADFTQRIRLNPNDAVTYNNRGIAYSNSALQYREHLLYYDVWHTIRNSESV